MAEAEIWKTVPGCGDYEVSNLGRVRHARTGCPKVPTKRPAGLVINLYSNKKTNVRNLRSIVAEAFIGGRRPGEMTVHKDGDRSNCAASNLAYAPLGLRRPKYTPGKLTRLQADEIRKRARAGESVTSLAREFGVSASLVSNIKNLVKWRP